MTNELDRKDLKLQAYKERLTQVVLELEERVAELRVELTIQNANHEDQMNTANQRIAELETELNSVDENEEVQDS